MGQLKRRRFDMSGHSAIFSSWLKLGTKLDGSFGATVGKAEQRIKRLEETSNKFGNSNAFTKWESSANRAFGKVESRAERAHRKISGLFTGLGAKVAGIVTAFGGAWGAFEAIKHGSEISGERESIATQLKTLLENQNKGEYLQTLINQMRTYSDMESVFRYNTVANAAGQLLASKFKPEQILAQMRTMGELARDDETLKQVSDINAGVMNRGYVTKGDLNRMQQDAKVPIYSALLKAMGREDNRENEIALFKQLRTPSKNPVDAKYFFAAEKALAEGQFKGHQMAQLETFKGQLSSLKDRADDVFKGVGDSFNSFAWPVMHEINKISPVQIQSWFDRATKTARRFGTEIASAFDVEAKAGKLQEIASHFSSIFSQATTNVAKLIGVFGAGDSTFETTEKIIEKFNDALAWVDKHAKTIFNTFVMLQGLSLAAKVAEWTTAFAGLAGAMGKIPVLGKAFGAVPGFERAAAAEAALPTAEALGEASIINPVTLGLGVAGGAAWTTWKGLHANDTEMSKDAILAQRSAQATETASRWQAGIKPGQSAETNKAYGFSASKESVDAHEARVDAARASADKWWSDAGKSVQGSMQAVGDRWNQLFAPIQNAFKSAEEASRKEEESALQQANANKLAADAANALHPPMLALSLSTPQAASAMEHVHGAVEDFISALRRATEAAAGFKMPSPSRQWGPVAPSLRTSYM
jgi:hypothetical protein